jgi:hypothetical protein
MEEWIMDVTLIELMEILGVILRTVGATTFGLGMGWLAVQSVKLRSWHLSVATVLGLLTAFVFIGRWIPSPGTLGGFGLGVGVGLVIWGVGRVTIEDGPAPKKRS